MAYFSQKDPVWKNTKLGTCTTTIGSSGCFITSFCNLLKKFDIIKIEPDDFNDLCMRKCWYTNGCMFQPDKAARYFDMSYEKKYTYKGVCICETNFYKKLGFSQHFFLYDTDKKKRLDPLDLEPSWEDNNYPIVSYRVFTKIKPVEVAEIPETHPSIPEPQTPVRHISSNNG